MAIILNTKKLKMQSDFQTLANLKNDPTLLFVILFTIALVAFFILVPLYNILLESLGTDNGLSLQNYRDVFTMHGNTLILINTIVLGVVTASISVFELFPYSLYDAFRTTSKN